MKDLRPSFATCQLLDTLAERLALLEKKYEEQPKKLKRSKSRGFKHPRGSQELVFAKISQLESKIARQKGQRKKRPVKAFPWQFNSIVQSEAPAPARIN